MAFRDLGYRSLSGIGISSFTNPVDRPMAEETFNICTTGPALAALLHSMALQGQRDYDGLILGEALLGCQALDSYVRQPVAWPLCCRASQQQLFTCTH